MKLTIPQQLRLALVPIGVMIATKGLAVLSDEAERLDAMIEARQKALMPQPKPPTAVWNGYPACEHRPRTDATYAYPCTEGCNDGEPGPGDCEPSTESAPPPAKAPDYSSTPAPRRRWVLTPAGRLFWHAAAFGAGAYLAMKAQQIIGQRALAAELAAFEAADQDAAAVLRNPCHDCGKPVDPAVTFPGPRCIDCHLGPED